MSQRAESWAIVVPVKRLDAAKSRLAVEPSLRRDLALAMAADTVAAALAADPVALVVVVTDDPRARDPLTELGATVVPDVPDAGLNPALRYGAEVAVQRLPQAGVAAVSSDLAALAPAELAAALESAAGDEAAFVADAEGDGTTLLAARRGFRLQPQFGRGSAAAHRSAGAVDRSAAAGASVRRDVDTLATLRAAALLGLGRHTLSVVRRNPALVPGAAWLT